MKWSNAFATGIQRIDDQHRMLFKMTEDFRAALDEGKGGPVYGILLESLDQYARGHFAFEEDCMERYRCPVAEKNKNAHGRFVAIVAEFQQDYAKTGFDREDARRLVDILDEWLANHICRIDVNLKDFVQVADP
jgi:hemerythrin